MSHGWTAHLSMFTATFKQAWLHHRSYTPHVRFLTIIHYLTGGHRSPNRAAPVYRTRLSPSDFEPKSGAWYDHHFSIAKTVRPNRLIKPVSTFSRLVPRVVENNVAGPLRQNPLDFDRLERADDGAIGSCLELYIARVDEQTNDLSQARENYLLSSR